MVDANEIIPLCNGEFELFRVKPDSFDEVLELYLNNFVKDEPIHKCLNLFCSKTFKAKSAERTRNFLQDEVSFTVRHCATKKLAAVCINRIMTTSRPEPEFKPTSPAEAFNIYFDKRVKKAFNVFKEWNIDCAFETLFLTTNSDFSGRGFGTKLSQHSIDFARAMLNGTLKGSESLPAHVRDLKPKAVTSIYSSVYTQKIGEKIGMEVLARIPYTDYFYEGRPLSEIIEPIYTSVTNVAKRL